MLRVNFWGKDAFKLAKGGLSEGISFFRFLFTIMSITIKKGDIFQ